ncbi:hypothetical protein MJO29_013267 [Puccinia striiformis f. sp. tritici]|nr:hypothetical protein MJO29_013267 [Puccinia striiformis f. sp. tritici]
MESIVVDPQSPLPQGLDQLTFFGHFIPYVNLPPPCCDLYLTDQMIRLPIPKQFEMALQLWTLQAPPFCQVFGLEGNCHSQSISALLGDTVQA